MLSWADIEQMLVSGNLHTEQEWLEYKEAKNDIPKSMWETYSAFANQSGGFIILGVSEKEGLHILGVNNAEKIQELIFTQSRSKEKVSAALLSDGNVRCFTIKDKQVIVVYVPKAEETDRPVHLNQDLRRSYIRLKTGDHKLNDGELRSMISNATSKNRDGKILPQSDLNYLNLDTLNKYRNLLKAQKASEPLLLLSDE